MADIAQFFADNTSVLGRLAGNDVGAIVVGQIPAITATSSQPDFNLREALMNEFTSAAQQVNSPGQTFNALAIATNLRLESITGDATADAQMAELNTFLTNMDQDPGFRAALHGFTVNVGVDQLNFSNLAGDPATAAKYQAIITHLSEHEFGQESITRAITTLAQDPDDITSDDFKSALITETTNELTERFGNLEGAALLDTMKSTDGLLGDAATQTEFFAKLEADPATQDAFLSAVKSNPTLISSMALDSAQTPDQQGALASLINQPLDIDTTQFGQLLSDLGIPIPADVNASVSDMKTNMIQNVLGSPGTDFNELSGYLDDKRNADGSLDIAAIVTDVRNGNAPDSLDALAASFMPGMFDNFDWNSLLTEEGWRDLGARVHIMIDGMEDGWLKDILQVGFTLFEEMNFAMADGLKKIFDLGVGLAVEVERAADPGQQDRIARVRAEMGLPPQNGAATPQQAAFGNATTAQATPGTAGTTGAPLVNPGIARALGITTN